MDVIVTSGTALLAAKQATSVIPIVFVVANDPVGSGFVASLSRPGGNITGLWVQSTDLAGKRLELFREVVPDLHRLAIMAHVGNPGAVLELAEVQAAARALGIDAPPTAWALVLISVNLAILLPSTPGQIGVLEAGAVAALAAFGVPAAPAVAFALVYHAVHFVPSTALGLLGLCLPWR